MVLLRPPVPDSDASVTPQSQILVLLRPADSGAAVNPDSGAAETPYILVLLRPTDSGAPETPSPRFWSC